MVIRRGPISQEIIALANKDKVDIIAMGAKGRSGLLDMLIGSVAQRVSSSAKQPVYWSNNIGEPLCWSSLATSTLTPFIFEKGSHTRHSNSFRLN